MLRPLRGESGPAAVSDMTSWMLRRLAPALGAAVAVCPAQAQAPFERPAPFAGSVLAAKGGEELRFKAEADWRNVIVRQNVLGGDTLRTNEAGSVALLFEDRTQVRVGRSTTLTIKDVARGPNGETLLSLPQGSLFARAARGGSGVIVDTPAAAAAVRGTDWTLAVEGKKTSLVVMEGEVTLANPQGSVTVRQGEGAEALVGQAPRKLTLVDIKGRQQLLNLRELRDTFFDLSPSDLDRTRERRARAAALGIPPAARSTDQWLTLAESALYFDGPAAAGQAVAEAERRKLSTAERARARLTRGFLLARRQKWVEAAAEFRAAAPGLDRGRRDTAAYALWVADALANPTRRPPPRPATRSATSRAFIAQASVESFVDSDRRGAEILREAAKRYPDDVLIAGGMAAILLQMNDAEGARPWVERARAIDPEDPFTLQLSAAYRWTLQGDLDGARDDLKRAIATAPGNSALYGTLALIEAERGALREAEAAHLKEIELDPDSPKAYANYANLLVDQNQLVRAEAALQKAEALDPNGYYQLVSRGRLLVRKGETAAGIDRLLAGAALKPTYADGQVALAVASYAAGRRDETMQALDNADRYDDDNPITPLVRSGIAVDEYRADDAIAAAREGARRRVAIGGDYADVGANREDGSSIGSALRFLGLDDWARYYGDRFFDPLSSPGYFDQAIADRPTPFARASSALDPFGGAGDGGAGAGSLVVQGMLLSPLSVAAPERRTDFSNTPFFETAVEGGVSTEKGRKGWLAGGTTQGLVMDPTPFAYYLDASIRRPADRFGDVDDELDQGVAFVTAQPTPYDSLVFFGSLARNRQGLSYPDFLSPLPDTRDIRTGSFGAAWSHVVGERNVVQAMAVGSDTRVRTVFDTFRLILTPPALIPVEVTTTVRQKSALGGVSHFIGFGDVDVRYGVEGIASWIRRTDRLDVVLPGVPGFTSGRADAQAGRVYADATWTPNDRFKLEAGLYASASSVDAAGDGTTVERLDPRIGLGFAPAQGHWLRAAYRRESPYDATFTLSPVTTVGLSPNEIPLSFGGRSETLAARWDAEWSERLFTAVEFQSQELKGLALGVDDSLIGVEAPKGRVDRLAVSANAWLGGGFGLFGSYARSWSEAKDDIEITDPTGVVRVVLPQGGPLPYVPRHAARGGIAYVSPHYVKVTLSESYYGASRNELGERSDPFFSTDASLTWEPFDKRLSVGFQALNIFDKRFENASGVMGQGRSFLATARVRL